VEQTLMMAGDLDRLLAFQLPSIEGSGDEGIRIIGLGLAGRRDEARALLLQIREQQGIPTFRTWWQYLLAWIERRPEDMVAKMSGLEGLKINNDPEAIFQEGWLLCDVGEHARGLDFLRRAVAKGYFVAPTLSGRPQFDALRADPGFQAVLAEAEAGREQALTAFRESGGERLLGR
jgi:hypothetical protein